MPTVVVLPLVPVRVSQGARVPSGRGACSRQASSTSLHVGTPAAAARVSSGETAGMPGETTTTSGGAASTASASSAGSGAARSAARSGTSPLSRAASSAAGAAS